MRPGRPEPGAAERQQLDTQSSRWGDEVLARSQAHTPAPQELPAWGEYAVQEVHHDYLVCKLVSNGATHGSNVNVAKDPALRRSLLHNRKIDDLRYVYTDVQARRVQKETPVGFDVEIESRDQIIIPKYLVPADAQETPPGGLVFPGSIITAVPLLTLVEDDGGSPLYCQLREVTQRAYANDEEAG